MTKIAIIYVLLDTLGNDTLSRKLPVFVISGLTALDAKAGNLHLIVDYLYHINVKITLTLCRAHKVTVFDLSKFINVYNPLCLNIYSYASSKHQPFEVTIVSVDVVNIVCSYSSVILA